MQVSSPIAKTIKNTPKADNLSGTPIELTENDADSELPLSMSPPLCSNREADLVKLQGPVIASETNVVMEKIAETKMLYELKQYLGTIESDCVVIISAKRKKQNPRTERGSKYRGVSKNGRKWQVSLSYFTC